MALAGRIVAGGATQSVMDRGFSVDALKGPGPDSERPTAPPHRAGSGWAERVAVLCLCVATTAAYAVYAGQDRNWDQRNYHIYVVHAWLTGRTFTDLEPAQIQSWLPPTPHLLQVLLVQHTPPVVAGALMGAIAGVNGFLLWLLVRRLQANDSSRIACWCAGLVVILGLSGSIFLSFLGTTFAEYICSPFVLMGLVCLTSDGRTEVSNRRFLLAGLCLGAACGLKLTNLVYAIGMTATLAVLWPFLRFRATAIAAYVVGGAAGYAILGGYWAITLWRHFKSPVFPFFNALFGSRWFAPENFADHRFLPPSFVHALITYPFAWLLGGHPTNELPFREPRFAYAAVLVPVAMAVALVGRVRNRRVESASDRGAEARNFWLTTMFFVLSFAVWMKQFAVQRYALPLELLSGVVVVLSLETIWRRSRATVAVLLLLVLFALGWTRPPDWERLPYGPDWFGVETAEPSAGPVLYVMLSWRPMSYVIPFLRRDNQYVRLGGNMPLEPEMPLGQRAIALLGAHRGPIRTLALEPIEAPELARLKRFGLSPQEDSCTTFRSRIDTFTTCALAREQPYASSR
jgi:hypothetical protein